jgi:hypothetical protein
VFIVNARVLVGALALVAAPVFAQPSVFAQPPVAPPSPVAPVSPTSQARFQVRIMEGVLESAVQQGAQAVSTQMRMVSPEIALFSGPARARGFRLDGYGVFFCIDVPALHRSVTWSVRTLSQSNADLARAIKAIRRMVQEQNDQRMKRELEQALRLVELQVSPLPAPSAAETVASADVRDPNDRDGSPAGPSSAPAAESAPPQDVPQILANPSGAYTSAVQHALVEAMLDYGSTLSLDPDEWLTVAARETIDAMIAGDLTETVTITLRIRASDLTDLKSGRATRDEVRRRVEVREF